MKEMIERKTFRQLQQKEKNIFGTDVNFPGQKLKQLLTDNH